MIEWNHSLSVGNAEIDGQQRELFAAAARVVAGARADDVELAKLVQRLVNVARTMFSAEERMLEEAGAPTLVRHAHEHQRFLQDLAGVLENLSRGQRDAVDALDIAKFLPSWLSSHLSKSDRDLARLARKRAATG